MGAPTPDETILGLLAVRARHGYELLECFHSDSQLGRVWNMSTSQLYAVLKRLERQEWIVGREVIVENAPHRTEYSLTGQGRVQLMAWLRDPNPSPTVRRVRVGFLSRLYIMRMLNLPTQDAVRAQREACVRERSRLEAERRSAVPGIELLAVEFVLAQLDAVLDWLDRCELAPQVERVEGDDGGTTQSA
ncbi:MAG TPA: PadR family transcriptional regulator [Chloroflexia bacterium]|nr:PadR family transcriptional regulator [Chloroflexia bacterium]